MKSLNIMNLKNTGLLAILIACTSIVAPSVTLASDVAQSPNPMSFFASEQVPLTFLSRQNAFGNNVPKKLLLDRMPGASQQGLSHALGNQLNVGSGSLILSSGFAQMRASNSYFRTLPSFPTLISNKRKQ